MMRWALAGLLAGLPSVVQAADAWTNPHPGIRMLTRTQSSPNWRIWALEIDMCASGVSVRATRSNERQRTVSSFAGLVGVEAAINGDFFSYATYGTSGLAVGDGEPWADTSDGNGSGFVVFGNDRMEIKLPGSQITAADDWMEQLVSGRRRLVDEGVPMSADGTELCDLRHPRTAAGFSEDGRTLYLAVVDGRTTVSVGMTCPELGTLMAELGAWTAINLDGGGSTTMWVAGEGVVNSPSDGGQRVVGNHLGIHATGVGDPGSCNRSWEESAVHGDAYDASTTSDIDGDGDADVCVRTSTGIECALVDGGALVASVAGPTLSDDTGWSDPSNWSTLRMGDLDGDGRADLCARANAGIRCWTSLGDAFEDASIEGPALADEVGWAAPIYHGTLRMADVDGDGRDDLCARSASDFRCYRSSGAGFEDPWTLAELGDDQGWDDPARHGTIRMGDVDGDARSDLCARSAEGVRCWPSTGEGFGAPIEGPAWSDAAGWRRPEYWATIRVVDVDGDGRADVCGRASDGLRCHLSLGDGFGDAILGPNWSDGSGWGDYDNYSTIRFGDIDGDGDADVCARANAGIRCSRWTGEGFEADPLVGPELSDDTGWSNVRFYSTIRLADVDGDGMADLCARASAGLRCWPSLGDAFGEPWIGPEWSDAAGFDTPAVYETLRAVRPRLRCVVEESCNGEDDDCDGEIDEGCPGDGGSDGGGSGEGSGGSEGAGTGGDDGTGGIDPALPQGFGEDGDGGCGCSSQPPAGGGGALLGLMGLLGLRARRRRRAGRGPSRRAWVLTLVLGCASTTEQEVAAPKPSEPAPAAVVAEAAPPQASPVASPRPRHPNCPWEEVAPRREPALVPPPPDAPCLPPPSRSRQARLRKDLEKEWTWRWSDYKKLEVTHACDRLGEQLATVTFESSSGHGGSLHMVRLDHRPDGAWDITWIDYNHYFGKPRPTDPDDPWQQDATGVVELRRGTLPAERIDRMLRRAREAMHIDARELEPPPPPGDTVRLGSIGMSSRDFHVDLRMVDAAGHGEQRYFGGYATGGDDQGQRIALDLASTEVWKVLGDEALISTLTEVTPDDSEIQALFAARFWAAKDREPEYGLWYLRERLLGLAAPLGTAEHVPALLDVIRHHPDEHASDDRSRVLAINAIAELTGLDVRYDPEGQPRKVKDVAAEVLADCSDR